MIKLTVVIIEACHCCQLQTKFYPKFILLSRPTPYADEIIGDHQCGFHCNRSITDQIFCINQILKKICENNGTVHQLFIDLKKPTIQLERKYYTIFSLSLQYLRK
jgi:hypothetical protein